MSKKGTFGGTRFGGQEYGRSGFKRGFGRSSFGYKSDIEFENGITKEMMKFFKQIQSGKSEEKPRKQSKESVVSLRRDRLEANALLSPMSPAGQPIVSVGANLNTLQKRQTKFRPKSTRK